MGRPAGNDGRSVKAAAGEQLLLFKENRLAHAALGRLAPPSSSFPLVYVFGPSGVGKTHLVRDFVRDVRKLAPTVRVQHVMASEFAAEVSEAAVRDEQAELQSRYTDIDLLILEDISAICGRATAQRLLIVILDDLRRTGGRVIVTCSKPPGQLKSLARRLVSRLRGGICVGMEPLGEDSQRGLARHLASSRQIPLSVEAADMLAKSGLPTPRELLAALVNLDMRSRARGRDCDASLLRAELAPGVLKRKSLPEIARVVSRFFELPVAKLRSTSRQQSSLVPRQVAMLLARELSGQSAAVIARFFGRNNHTTVVHACRRTRALLAADAALANDVEGLRRELRGP